MDSKEERARFLCLATWRHLWNNKYSNSSRIFREEKLAKIFLHGGGLEMIKR